MSTKTEPPKLTAPQEAAILATPYIQDARIPGHPRTLAVLVREELAAWRYFDGKQFAILTAKGLDLYREMRAAKEPESQACEGCGADAGDPCIPLTMCTAEEPQPQPRPAAEVLAAEPIPCGVSVLEGMPGREIAREELRTAGDVLIHADYVVQIRDAGRWILPNHDTHADVTRGGVAMVQRRTLDQAPGRARTTLDADGTVYVSNGRQAARYIPAARIADHSNDFCPGCDTPYATNGDGPCTGDRSAPARQDVQEAAREILAEVDAEDVPEEDEETPLERYRVDIDHLHEKAGTSLYVATRVVEARDKEDAGRVAVAAAVQSAKEHNERNREEFKRSDLEWALRSEDPAHYVVKNVRRSRKQVSQ